MSPFRFNNSYYKLGDDFSVNTNPTPVAQPELIIFNDDLAQQLGLVTSELTPEVCTSIFSGNTIPEDSDPLAMAYAGHQFGGFSPQLGDGRAILLGEIICPDNVRYDIQLKGSGPTAFSRAGDGRAALGPVLREYLLSEAMAKLGVPTTRALAAVTTGEQVARTRLLPGAVLTRVATGFVRVGTFQYFSAKENGNAIKKLADYVIERSFPEANQAANPYEALLRSVIDRQAALIAQWIQLGFIHGVMNTDNMSVVGETIDYGPCAFMDAFSHQQVYSSIDRQGRYAYNNQPSMAQWNLIRLTETLLPLLGGDADDDGETALAVAQTVLNTFAPSYENYWLTGMRQKIGLNLAIKTDNEADKNLVMDLLDLMADHEADFTLTFYYLSQLEINSTAQDEEIKALFAHHQAFDNWLLQWRERLIKEEATDAERQATMQHVNPIYIPRNHQVEKAIRAAEDKQDFSVFHELNEVLQKPFEYQHGRDQYRLPPEPEEIVQETFCGT